MPVFKYKGFNAQGASVAGELEASGQRDAAVQIREQGIYPEAIEERKRAAEFRFSRSAKVSFVISLTRHLAICVGAGVPLIEALQSLSKEYAGVSRDAILSLKEKVEGGMSLSRAMQMMNGLFPEFYVNMIEAGEASGTLEKVLLRLADFIDRQNTIRMKVRSSLLYPMLMLSVSLIVLFFIFTFVIPRIARIFRDMKSALPFTTQILVAVSSFFVNYWWVVLLVTAAMVLGIRRFVLSRRDICDALLLRLPGGLVQSLYYARFSHTLGFLLEGGLPMLRALRLAGKAIGNRELEASVLRAEERVTGGNKLSASLDLFPPLFTQLVATGERSGRLAETLHKAADAYEDEFSRKTTRLVTLFEPVLVIIMGAIVCFIVMSVVLPLFQLNQIIR